MSLPRLDLSDFLRCSHHLHIPETARHLAPTASSFATHTILNTTPIGWPIVHHHRENGRINEDRE